VIRALAVILLRQLDGWFGRRPPCDEVPLGTVGDRWLTDHDIRTRRRMHL
jgi:hypothetical protein